MIVDTDIIRRELEAGDIKSAQLREALSALRERAADQSGSAVLNALLLGPEQFEQRIQREQFWCEQTRDNLSVIEIAFDEALSAEEEAKFAEQLLELAHNPGDFVGITGDRAYAVGMASVDAREAQRLLGVAIGMASYAAPARDFASGYQSLTTVGARPPLQLVPSPNRSRYAPADHSLSRQR